MTRAGGRPSWPRDRTRSPGARDGCNHPQRGMRAIGFALFEIAGIDRHPVRNMSEAKDRLVARAGEGVERCRFHLDGEDVAGMSALDCRGGFAERRVGGPGCALVDRQPDLAQRAERRGYEGWVYLAEFT